MKILLFCPTYKLDNGELAIRNETLESISKIKVPEGVDLEVEISTNNLKAITGIRNVDHENTLMIAER